MSTRRRSMIGRGMLRGMTDERTDVLPHQQRRARRPDAAVRLARARDGALLGGVASGIARFLGVRTWVVRAAFVCASVASWGIFAIGYPLLWLLLPRVPVGTGSDASHAQAGH